MLYFFNTIALNVCILFIWFKTDAFIDYCSLFNLIPQTINNYRLTTGLSFPQFLYITYKNGIKNRFKQFLLKLVTCPVCLCMWLSIITSNLINSIILTPLLYILSLFIFFQLSKYID